MKAKAATKATSTPVVPFPDFAARIKAVARGDAGLPEWAGTNVYSSESAREQWTAPALIKHAKLAAFIKLLKGATPHLAISGRTMEFDGKGKCVTGCAP